MKLEQTRYMQYVAAVTGTLAIATGSLYITWPSPILPKIAAGDSPLGNTTQEETSWIVSCLLLGFIPGSIISGWTIETFGRRGSILISGVPLLLPWYFIAFANYAWIVCIARFIAGVAIQNAANGIMLYNGEIAEKDIRGRLGSTMSILGLIGEIISLCVGPYISYKALTLISSVVPLIFITVFYFMPESPYYLIKVEKQIEAKDNLRRLLSNNISDDKFDEQMRIIKSTVDEEMNNKSSLLEFLTKKEYRSSLVVSIGLHTINQFTGFQAIAAYMQTIIKLSNGGISPEFSSLICGVVQLPAVFVVAAVVDRAGRKPLLIISLLGCALGLSSVGIYFYFKDVLHADTTPVSWIPMAGILLYIVSRPIGMGTLVYVLMGELFLTNIKGHAIAVSTLYKSTLAFIVTKSFGPVSSALGLHIIFAFYAMFCIVGIIFVYFVVPETKGKTFAEIREKLKRSSKKHNEEEINSLQL